MSYHQSNETGTSYILIW